jgi:hypothetical protein
MNGLVVERFGRGRGRGGAWVRRCIEALLSGGNERGAGKGRTPGCGGVVRPWGGGQLEVEGGVDRWDLVVNDWERGRERWAGGASWAGKGDGPAACCECGLKKK